MSIEKSWSKLPRALLERDDVTLSDIRVYGLIAYKAGTRGYWYGTQTAIREQSGVSERSTREAVGRLIQWGYLETRRLGADQRTVILYGVTAQVQSLDDVLDRPAVHRRSPSGGTPPVQSGGTPPVLARASGSGSGSGSRSDPLEPSSEGSVSGDQGHEDFLTDEQSALMRHLRRRMHEDVAGGADAVRDPTWGESEIRAGATREDIDEAVTVAVQRGIVRLGRAQPFVLAVLQGRIEDREAGRDRIPGNGANAAARRDHAGGSGAGRVGGVRGGSAPSSEFDALPAHAVRADAADWRGPPGDRDSDPPPPLRFPG